MSLLLAHRKKKKKYLLLESNCGVILYERTLTPQLALLIFLSNTLHFSSNMKYPFIRVLKKKKITLPFSLLIIVLA